MKSRARHLSACFVAVGLLLPILAKEEKPPKHPSKPMLWKVEGKGLEVPSWLFGTIHLGKGRLSRLHPAAAKALDESDVLFTELPMDPAAQIGMAGHHVRKDGRTLSDSIGPELSKQLDAELAAISPALTSDALQGFKTWAVAVQVPMLAVQLEGAPALDTIVYRKAKAAGKETGALEKAADQFDIFDGLSEAEQVGYLAETLRMQEEARAKGGSPLGALVEAYLAGDDERAEAEMRRQFRFMAEGEHAELGKKLMKQLLDDRNATMARDMAALLAADPGKSHFFAVGTGHYLGKGSIVELLEKRGYEITRVAE